MILIFAWQLDWEKKNKELKIVKVRLKIDLKSHPSCADELSK